MFNAGVQPRRITQSATTRRRARGFAPCASSQKLPQASFWGKLWREPKTPSESERARRRAFCASKSKERVQYWLKNAFRNHLPLLAYFSTPRTVSCFQSRVFKCNLTPFSFRRVSILWRGFRCASFLWGVAFASQIITTL